jgi:hypothetical protein
MTATGVSAGCVFMVTLKYFTGMDSVPCDVSIVSLCLPLIVDELG